LPTLGCCGIFAVCKPGFAVCLWHTAKCLCPIVQDHRYDEEIIDSPSSVVTNPTRRLHYEIIDSPPLVHLRKLHDDSNEVEKLKWKNRFSTQPNTPSRES